MLLKRPQLSEDNAAFTCLDALSIHTADNLGKVVWITVYRSGFAMRT